MKRPLFIGNSDVDQLFKIFNILGVPTEDEWPINSVIPLESFNSNTNFKKINRKESLKKILPNMNANAIDLTLKLLDFDMHKRITAKDALSHPYFKLDNDIELNEI